MLCMCGIHLSEASSIKDRIHMYVHTRIITTIVPVHKTAIEWMVRIINGVFYGTTVVIQTESQIVRKYAPVLFFDVCENENIFCSNGPPVS